MWKFLTADVIITLAVIGGTGLGYLLAGATGMYYGLLFGASINAVYLLLRFIVIPLAIRFVKK
jgi:hypothetical protein